MTSGKERFVLEDEEGNILFTITWDEPVTPSDKKQTGSVKQ